MLQAVQGVWSLYSIANDNAVLYSNPLGIRSGVTECWLVKRWHVYRSETQILTFMLTATQYCRIKTSYLAKGVRIIVLTFILGQTSGFNLTRLDETLEVFRLYLGFLSDKVRESSYARVNSRANIKHNCMEATVWQYNRSVNLHLPWVTWSLIIYDRLGNKGIVYRVPWPRWITFLHPQFASYPALRWSLLSARPLKNWWRTP